MQKMGAVPPNVLDINSREFSIKESRHHARVSMLDKRNYSMVTQTWSIHPLSKVSYQWQLCYVIAGGCIKQTRFYGHTRLTHIFVIIVRALPAIMAESVL